MATHDNSGYPLVLHSSADPTTLGGTAICGFSTVGSVGVIAMSHIIQTLDLDPMGTSSIQSFLQLLLFMNQYQNIQYESIKERTRDIYCRNSVSSSERCSLWRDGPRMVHQGRL
ncbi:MAG: hypothetical protein Ct9H90mP23_3300 [Methanobacteriota archaeon]|nr:MAG: hypothetical protein Ct9H90mP23_3300 [Euryarchaeota archaeon]